VIVDLTEDEVQLIYFALAKASVDAIFDSSAQKAFLKVAKKIKPGSVIARLYEFQQDQGWPR
jgi:hypothetical protein